MGVSRYMFYIYIIYNIHIGILYIYDMLKHIFDFENNTFVIDLSLIAEKKPNQFQSRIIFSKVIPISTLHKVHTYSSRSTSK